MSAQGNFSLSGNINNLPGNGSLSFGPYTAIQTNSPGLVEQVALSSGNNTVALPVGAAYVVIVPPNAVSPSPNPAYAGVLTLRGVGDSVGVPLSVINPWALPFDSGSMPASIVINASIATTVELWAF